MFDGCALGYVDRWASCFSASCVVPAARRRVTTATVRLGINWRRHRNSLGSDRRGHLGGQPVAPREFRQDAWQGPNANESYTAEGGVQAQARCSGLAAIGFEGPWYNRIPGEWWREVLRARRPSAATVDGSLLAGLLLHTRACRCTIDPWFANARVSRSGWCLSWRSASRWRTRTR